MMRCAWILAAAVLFTMAAGQSAVAQPLRPDAGPIEGVHVLPPEAQGRIAERRERVERATPEERQRLRERRMRRFAHGDPDGPGALRQLDRQDRLALRRQIRSLPEGERRELRSKLSRFHSLPEAERSELQGRFAVLQSLDSDERRQIHADARRFRAMAPEQRQRLRDAMKRFRSLPPDEQQEWLERALAETAEQTR
jgi:hypothetical protein